jgi:hypothetical protein
MSERRGCGWTIVGVVGAFLVISACVSLPWLLIPTAVIVPLLVIARRRQLRAAHEHPHPTSPLPPPPPGWQQVKRCEACGGPQRPGAVACRYCGHSLAR